MMFIILLLIILALSNYIKKIRDSPLSYQHHPDIIVKSTDTGLKITSKADYSRNGYRVFVWDSRIHIYSVKINGNPKGWIGFAPSSKVDVDKDNRSYSGWYFDLEDSLLFTKDEGYTEYTHNIRRCKKGDIITCIYDASSSELSYEMNGVSLGVAFTNVKGEDIAPVIDIYMKNSVTLSVISFG